MADNLDAWIPEEVGGPAVQALGYESALERVGTRHNMVTDVKNVVVGADFTIGAVAKHSALPETTVTAPVVVLTAQRVGGFTRIASEDINDASFDVVATRRVDAARNLAKFLDNAAFGVTGTVNGTTRPFASVYQSVKAANPSNVIATGGALTYDDINDALGVAEASDFAGEGIVIVAHPVYRSLLRGLKDTNGNPLMAILFADGRNIESVLGYEVVWSNGLKTSATASSAPAGNALFVAAPKALLVSGSNNLPGLSNGVPGFALEEPTGSTFITDEWTLKAEVRRAFAVGDTAGIGIVEKS